MRNTKRFRTIVVAVDFSAKARAALTRALTLPLASNPVVHLVHVVPVPSLTPLAVAKDLASERLQTLATSVRKRLRGARVRVRIAAGRPADELVRVAREQSADLIVAGRRGAGGFTQLMLGSTAERLARLSPIPVLIVASTRASYEHALFTLDVTDDVSRIIQTAARILPANVGPVILFHVYWAFGEGYLRFGGASRATIKRHRAMVRDQAAVELEAAAETLRELGLESEPRLENGEPRTDVPRAIRRRKPGIAIIGNHARGAVARALLGSVAQEVLRQTKCDVLLVPI